jgi:hypothetical protein
MKKNITAYINEIAIPDIMDMKSRGYTRTALYLGTEYDAVIVAKAIQSATGFKCTAMAGTVYIRLF